MNWHYSLLEDFVHQDIYPRQSSPRKIHQRAGARTPLAFLGDISLVFNFKFFFVSDKVSHGVRHLWLVFSAAPGKGEYMAVGSLKGRTILVVDDNPMNRLLLQDIIGGEANFVEAADGASAIARIKELGTEISVVLLDIVMPILSGLDVLEFMSKAGYVNDIPVIMVSSETDSDIVMRAYELGATDFINRPFVPNIVRRRVINTIMLYAKQRDLIGLMEEQILARERDNMLMVSMLSHIVEFRNGESGSHVTHVSNMTRILLRAMGAKSSQYFLSEEDIRIISLASSLHDVGKISIPDEILNKPGRLTPEEFEVMKAHTTKGAEMLASLDGNNETKLVKTAYEIVRRHHERFDGKGYPDGISGNDIPLSAQVVSLADVYDALRSERVYKKAFPREKALEMIVGGECGIFNPDLLEVFLESVDEMEQVVSSTEVNLAEQVDGGSGGSLLSPRNAGEISARTVEQLEYERQKYRFFASMSSEVQFEYTYATDLLVLNDHGPGDLGLDEAILSPRADERFVAFFGQENLDHLLEAIAAATPEDPLVHMKIVANPVGGPRWFELTARVIWTVSSLDTKTSAVIGKLVDINERQENLNKLSFKATHDSLTGLMNHANAKRVINDRLIEKNDSQLVLCVLDIDNFKAINDTRGHLFGDDILTWMASRMNHSVRDRDLLARVGGDEFLIFLEVKGDPQLVVERIFNRICGNYSGWDVTVSMGVAVAPAEPISYEDLFRQADAALYIRKGSGRNGYTFYENEQHSDPSFSSSITPIDSGE